MAEQTSAPKSIAFAVPSVRWCKCEEDWKWRREVEASKQALKQASKLVSRNTQVPTHLPTYLLLACEVEEDRR